MFIVRKATKEDVKGIAKVNVDSWKATYKGIVVQSYLNSLTYHQKEDQWSQANFDCLYVPEKVGEELFSIHNREHKEIAYGWTDLHELKNRLTGGQWT